MSDRTYNKFGHRAFMNLPPMTASTGTNAALGTSAAANQAFASYQVVVPFPLKVTAAMACVTTGATTATTAWNYQLVKSTAGTGTMTPVGTFAVGGTVASNSCATLTLGTNNTLAAGDILTLNLPALTVARSGDVVTAQVAYEELYN